MNAEGDRPRRKSATNWSCPRAFALIGPDGAGKSELARLAATTLHDKGIRTRVVWLRSFPVLSLGLLAVLHATRKLNANLRRVPEDSSQLISRPLAILLVHLEALDYSIGYLVKVKIPVMLGQSTTICDRFAWDLIVDLSNKVANPDWIAHLPGMTLLARIGRQLPTLLVVAPVDVLQIRRLQQSGIGGISRRIEQYRMVASENAIEILENDRDISSSLEVLINWIRSLSDRTPSSGVKGPRDATSRRQRLLTSANLVARNWLVQSVTYMDRTEQLFKLMTTVGIAAVFWIGFVSAIGLSAALIMGLLLAHTLNWLLNGHFYGLMKNVGRPSKRSNLSTLKAYRANIRDRLEEQPWVLYAGVFGSIARNEEDAESDFDLRILRKRGFANGLISCLFLMRLRSEALIRGFPLDVYLLDTDRGLSKLRSDERVRPVVLVDRGRTEEK